MEGKLGTLQAGAFADLLVVDGDPLQDLGVFQDQGRHLAAIMKGGVFHKNRLQLSPCTPDAPACAFGRSGTRSADARRMTRRPQARDRRRAGGLRPQPPSSGRRAWRALRPRARALALNAAAALALGFILLPLVLVTWLAFFRQEIPSFPPEGYSLRWFGAVLANSSFVGGFLLSLQVGVAATLIGLALAVPASLALARRPLPGPGAINTLLLLPLVVPGVVLGTSIYVAQIEAEIVTGLPLLGSTAGLVARPRPDRHPLGGAARHREPRRLRPHGRGGGARTSAPAPGPPSAA